MNIKDKTLTLGEVLDMLSKRQNEAHRRYVTNQSAESKAVNANTLSHLAQFQCDLVDKVIARMDEPDYRWP